MNNLILLFLTFALSACVSDTYKTIDLDSIDSDRVTLYYTTYPTCKFDTVGYIESTGAYYTKNDIFDYVINEAANLGADGVIIDYLQQSESKYYSVVAEAIRCYEVKLEEPSF